MKIDVSEVKFPSLNLKLKIYVGIPNRPGPYKVLYMHDGQNLFNDAWASYGTAWKVDKALESLGMNDVLVVGIQCPDGWRRVDVYAPFSIDYEDLLGEPVKGGEGKAYLEDMVNVVMPWVEKNYPILKGPEYTAMMGASMGGVISLFAGFEYPDIFGRIASLSGAYYVSQKAFLNYLKGPFKNVPSVFYLDVGDREEGLSSKTTYVQVHNEIDEALHPYKPKMKYRSKIIPGGVHNERAWEQRLPNILPFLWA
jgi:predicted alpha/beta superfamily hydrolase